MRYEGVGDDRSPKWEGSLMRVATIFTPMVTNKDHDHHDHDHDKDDHHHHHRGHWRWNWWRRCNEWQWDD